MRYQLVVLDMAGTTVADTGGLVAQAFVEALAADGCAVAADDVRVLMGYRKPEAIARVLAGCGEPADAGRVARIHADFVARMLRRYRDDAGIAPLPGAEATFDALRARGIKVALNTGFSRDIATAIVERLRWHDRIDAYAASDDVPEGRPAPYMIERLMRDTGVADAARVVKVGDTEVDVREGRNAGSGLVVAVLGGAFSREELVPHAPDHILARLDELPALL